MSESTSTNTTREATFNVRGMSCGGCAAHVTRTIQDIAGVASCQVNLAAAEASVRFDPSRTSLAAITQAVSSAGYPAAAKA